MKGRIAARLRRECWERVSWVGVIIALACAVLAGAVIGFHQGYRLGWSDGWQASEGLEYLPAAPTSPGLLPVCRQPEAEIKWSSAPSGRASPQQRVT